jgi:hypothetical protein
MSLPTVFSTYRPRPDVLGGTVRDDEFMADLRLRKLAFPRRFAKRGNPDTERNAPTRER